MILQAGSTARTRAFAAVFILLRLCVFYCAASPHLSPSLVGAPLLLPRARRMSLFWWPSWTFCTIGSVSPPPPTQRPTRPHLPLSNPLLKTDVWLNASMLQYQCTMQSCVKKSIIAEFRVLPSRCQPKEGMPRRNIKMRRSRNLAGIFFLLHSVSSIPEVLK